MAGARGTQFRDRPVRLEALAKALGPVGMVRFLHQFEAGQGDHTKERKEWLKGPDVRPIAEEIKKRRKNK
jgi:hypothetical protein